MKKIYLTESQLRDIIQATIEEQSFFKDGRNPLSRVRDAISGLKGMYRGEGYEFYSNLSSLQGFVKRLKRLDVPNEEVINQLGMLITRIDNSKMKPAAKNAIKREINLLITDFGNYRTRLDGLITKLKNKQL
jgi:hypothetical protein